jgi:predicted nucleic acid-binding protein
VPSVAVDTGPLVALFDKDEREHASAKEFVSATRANLVTNVAVITEALFLLAFSTQVQTDFLLWAVGGLEVDGETAGDLPRIVAIMKKYDDLPADFADASLVAMCERRGIVEVATLDADFDIYRTADRKHLRNVFSVR